MSMAEFGTWVSYRQKRGSLNQGLRSEHGFAMLASMFANRHSKKGGYQLHDFAPYHDQPAVTLEKAMETWR